MVEYPKNTMSPMNLQRGRRLAIISICLGISSFILPNAFTMAVAQNLVLVLSASGLIAGAATLFMRDKGKLATITAIVGVMISSVWPLFFCALIFSSRFNGIFASH